LISSCIAAGKSGTRLLTAAVPGREESGGWANIPTPLLRTDQDWGTTVEPKKDAGIREFIEAFANEKVLTPELLAQMSVYDRTLDVGSSLTTSELPTSQLRMYLQSRGIATWSTVEDELLRPLCVRLAATYTGYARGVPPALLAHFLGRLADIGTPGYTMVTPQQLLVLLEENGHMSYDSTAGFHSEWHGRDAKPEDTGGIYNEPYLAPNPRQHGLSWYQYGQLAGGLPLLWDTVAVHEDPEALEETKVIHELWAHQSESEVEQSYALLVSQNEQEFYEEFARPMRVLPVLSRLSKGSSMDNAVAETASSTDPANLPLYNELSEPSTFELSDPSTEQVQIVRRETPAEDEMDHTDVYYWSEVERKWYLVMTTDQDNATEEPRAQPTPHMVESVSAASKMTGSTGHDKNKKKKKKNKKKKKSQG